MKGLFLETLGLFSLPLTPAYATTIQEYSKQADGSFSLKETVLSVALGPNKSLIAASLLVIGTILLLLAFFSQKQHSHNGKADTATQATVSVPKTVSIKGTLSLRALSLILGAILVALGALLSVVEVTYTATI